VDEGTAAPSVSRIEPLKKFARNLKRTAGGILAPLPLALAHQSALKASNNKSRLIKRMAYGYRDEWTISSSKSPRPLPRIPRHEPIYRAVKPLALFRETRFDIIVTGVKCSAWLERAGFAPGPLGRSKVVQCSVLLRPRARQPSDALWTLRRREPPHSALRPISSGRTRRPEGDGHEGCATEDSEARLGRSNRRILVCHCRRSCCLTSLVSQVNRGTKTPSGRAWIGTHQVPRKSLPQFHNSAAHRLPLDPGCWQSRRKKEDRARFAL